MTPTPTATTATRSAPPRPRADPRVRQRQIAVARAKGRTRLRILLALLVLVTLCVGGLGLVHSSLFAARTVSVTGALHTSRAEVLDATGLNHHPALIDVNTAEDVARLERLAWVKRATVIRSWPSTVRIELVERFPVATVQLGDRTALVDGSGRVLARVAVAPSGLVPIAVSGATPTTGRSFRGANGALVAVAAKTPRSLVSRIERIARDSRGIVVHLRAAPVVVFGSASDLDQKFVSLATVLADKTVLAGVVTIDLRVPSSPVLTS